MADDTKSRKPTRAEEAVLLGEEEVEKDLLFKVQMALANVFLGYWKHGLGVLGLILLFSFAYGTWKNHYRDTQRSYQAAMVRAERKLPQPSPGYPLVPMYDVDEPEVKASIEEVAGEFETVAEGASGPGEVLAWLRAGDLRQTIGDDAGALRDFTAAHAAGGKGVVAWAAAVRAARAMAEQGDVDGAATILRAFADEEKGVVAEQALYELGQVYLDAERPDDARKAFEELVQKNPDTYLAPRVASWLLDAPESGG